MSLALRSAAASPSAEALLDTLPWGLLVFDGEGVLRRLNRQAAAWWGLPDPAAALGQPLAALPAGQLPPALLADLAAAATGAQAAPLPAEFRLPGAAGPWLAQVCTPLPDGGLTVYWQNVTEARQTRQALLAAERRQADEQARRATDKYQTLFNAIDEGFALLEKVSDAPLDFRYAEVNPAFAQHTGAASAAGRTVREVFPDEPDNWVRACDNILRTGEALRFEGQLRAQPRTLDVYAFRVADGERAYVAALFTDISRRKQAEARLQQVAATDAFRVRLADALAPLTDPVAIQEAATGLTREFFGADRCYYCEIEADQVIIRRDDARPGLPSLAGTYPLGQFPRYAAALAAGRPFQVADVRTDPAVDERLRQLCEPLELIAYLDVPLIKNGRLVGVLCLAQRAPRAWTPTEVALTTEVAERAWAAVERARAEEARRVSEENYRSLFDAITEGLAVCAVLRDESGQATDLRYQELNRALEEQTGLARQQLLGCRLSDVLPPADLAQWLPRYAAVADGGQPATFEEYAAPLGRWFAVSVYPRRAGAELAVFYRDITERKTRERQQQYLLALADALRPLADADQVEAAACRLLGEYLGAHRVYYVAIAEAAGRARVGQQYLRPGATSIAGEYTIEAFGWTAPPLRRGEAVVVADVDQSDLVPPAYRAAMEAVEQRAIVLIPLLKNGAWLGVLAVSNDQPRAWPAAEVALARETLERTWAAAERARAEAALAVSEAKYRTLFETMDQGFCVMELVPDEAGQVADIIYREANAAFERHVGFGQVVGRRASEVFPRLEAQWVQSLARVQATGQAERQEGYNADSGHWFVLEYSRVGGPESRLVAAVFRDVTERKRREASLALLAQVSEALVRLRDIDETMNALGQQLAAYFGLSACAFAELFEDAEVGVISHEWRRPDAPSLLGTYRMREFMTGEVLASCRAGEAVVIRDVWADPRTEGELYATLGVGSFVSMPLVRGGEWRFLLVVYRPEAYDWRADEIELLREVTARIWARLERARAEEALYAREQQLRTLIENLPGGAVFVVDRALRYSLAEGEALRAAGFEPGDLVGRTIYDTTPPADQAVYEELYGRALAGGSFEYEHHVHGRDFLTRGVGLPDAAGQITTALAVSFDLTERRRAEQALRESEHRLRLATEAALLYAWEIDLTTGVAQFSDNVAAVTGSEPGPRFEENLLNIHPDDRARVREAFTLAESQGDRFDYEMRTIVPEAGAPHWYRVAGVLVRDAAGRATRAVGICQNITARQQAAEALQRAHERFRLAEEATNGFVYDWDLLTGRVERSASFGRVLGYAPGEVPETAAAWFALLHPADRPVIEQTFGGSAGPDQAGVEYRVRRGDGTYAWVLDRALTLRDDAGRLRRVVGTTVDITARKQAAAVLADYHQQLEAEVAERTAALRASQAQLQAVFDATTQMVQVLAPVRDEASGELVDFRFVLQNALAQRYLNRPDPTGDRVLKHFPGYRAAGVFDLYRHTLESGEPGEMELFYDADGIEARWLRVRCARMSDAPEAQLLVAFEDITARRLTEQERASAFQLLQQSEEVAGLGSWDYELRTGVFKWSAGMYRLFGLLVDYAPVSPQVYVDYAVPEDRPVAERVVAQLMAGAANFEETLRIQVGEQVKTLRIKAVVLRDEAGTPLRVLGVDFDLSDLLRLEAENLHLRLTQQQQRIAAVIEAQEEERRRIAESLHNGLGQLLYATKLQLDRLLAAPELTGAPELTATRHEVARRLGEAIRQARTLSHELTPGVVAEFGLRAALEDICRTLHPTDLRWQCLVHLDPEQPIPQPLQVAIYRLAQELTQNIMKHAQARQATLEVETLPGWIVLRAEDDGRGFDPEQPTDGLGLRTLHHRVALLGGTVHVSSAPGQGTQIQVRVPL